MESLSHGILLFDYERGSRKQKRHRAGPAENAPPHFAWAAMVPGPHGVTPKNWIVT